MMTVLFESATINEYLDDASPGRNLKPKESLRRVHNRSWIELISTLLVMRNRLQHAQTERESRKLAGCINRERQHLEYLRQQTDEGGVPGWMGRVRWPSPGTLPPVQRARRTKNGTARRCLNRTSINDCLTAEQNGIKCSAPAKTGAPSP
jgi:hypothetical protein